MNAYIRNKVVIGIYTTDVVTTEDCLIVPLSGRPDLPQLGWVYDEVADKFEPPKVVIEEVPLDEIKNAALLVVNSEASNVRRSYIGDIESQLAIYTAKFQDAKAFKARIFGDSVSSYAWLAAEVSATGVAPAVAADLFISNYSAMSSALSKSEEVRIYARRTIESATSLADVREAKTLAVSELKKLVK